MLRETLKCMDKFADIVLLQADAADTRTDTRTDTRSFRPEPIGIEFHKFPLDNVSVEVEILTGNFPAHPGEIDLTVLEDGEIRSYWPSTMNDIEMHVPHRAINEEYDRRLAEVCLRIDEISKLIETLKKYRPMRVEADKLIERARLLRYERSEFLKGCYAPRALLEDEKIKIKKALILLQVVLSDTGTSGTPVEYYIPTAFSGTSVELLWLLILFKHKCPSRLFENMQTNHPTFRSVNSLMFQCQMKEYATWIELRTFSRKPNIDIIMELLRLNAEVFNEIQYTRHISNGR